MKLSRITSILAGVGILAGAQAAFANGSITLNGEISAMTCKITSSTGSADLIVQLPSVASNTLTAVGQTSGWTNFSIILSDCEPGASANATIYFDPGANVDTATGRLNFDNTAPNPATGVQLTLRQAGSPDYIFIGAPIGQQGTKPVEIVDGRAEIGFQAGYYVNSIPVAAGHANSHVTYVIHYQ